MSVRALTSTVVQTCIWVRKIEEYKYSKRDTHWCTNTGERWGAAVNESYRNYRAREIQCAAGQWVRLHHNGVTVTSL